MMTYALMGLLVLTLVVTTLWGVKYDPKKESFMSVEDTTFLRGFWCVIVVLVHVPVDYQNPIQDMIGSFAYIGVTFFFMTSAYGLKWSLEHKPGYMKQFWRRRLPSILIPALIANILFRIVEVIQGKLINVWSFLYINDWVKVLLVNYLVFWVIYYILPRFIKPGRWQEMSICAFCIIWSLIEYITGYLAMGWGVERLGFVYGIILATFSLQIKARINRIWKQKVIVLFFMAVGLGITYLKFKPVFFFGDYILKICLGIVLTAFVIVVVSGVKVGNRVNAFLGSISYEVYLLHGLVFTIFSSTNWNSGVYIFISIMITILFAYIMKLIIDSIIKLL